MEITLSVLKEDPAKYFDMSRSIDVIVTRHGQRLGRIVCEERAVKLERLSVYDELMQFVRTSPSVPDSTVYDADKEERLRERGLL
jgi:hypothetical protein